MSVLDAPEMMNSGSEVISCTENRKHMLQVIVSVNEASLDPGRTTRTDSRELVLQRAVGRGCWTKALWRTGSCDAVRLLGEQPQLVRD